MFEADGRVALVTGAATGLGAAIAVALAEVGAHVAISDRVGVSLDDTEAAARRHGRAALPFAMDVCVPEQITAGVERVVSEFGRVDIVVNNAGICRPASGLEVTPEDWDDHFDTNVKGGFFVAQAAARSMIARSWGRIVFVGSVSGLVGLPGIAAYCATKGALVQVVRTLAKEWARYGVTVNAVAPTFVDTDLTRESLRDREARRYILSRIPGGRLPSPGEVAAAVVYLVSQEAGMTNGTVLSVDGAWATW